MKVVGIDPYKEKKFEVKLILDVRADFNIEQILTVGMQGVIDSSLGIRSFEIKKIKEIKEKK